MSFYFNKSFYFIRCFWFIFELFNFWREWLPNWPGPWPKACSSWYNHPIHNPQIDESNSYSLITCFIKYTPRARWRPRSLPAPKSDGGSLDQWSLASFWTFFGGLCLLLTSLLIYAGYLLNVYDSLFFVF